MKSSLLYALLLLNFEVSRVNSNMVRRFAFCSFHSSFITDSYSGFLVSKRF